MSDHKKTNAEVIGRLDALAGRRRSFLAAGAQQPPPEPTEDEDLPVLTEVVDINEVSGDQPNAMHGGALDPLIEEVVAGLAHAVQQRLSNALPVLLENAMQRVSDEVRQGLHEATENAIRDYLAKQRQMSLPLETTPD